MTESSDAAVFLKQLADRAVPRIDESTIPIYGLQDEKVVHDRTGVLFSISGHHFILTAAHELAGILKYNIPLFANQQIAGDLPIPLVNAKFHYTEEEGRDIAVIRLPQDVVDKLSVRKKFLTRANVRLQDESVGSQYMLFGYPMDWSLQPGEGLQSNPLVYITSRYAGTPNKDSFFDPRVHLLLDLDRYNSIDVVTDATPDLPKLQGVSGCGLWRIAKQTKIGKFSLVGVGPELVAIQHRWFTQSNYVQGTWVRYALELIQYNYPDVKNALNLTYPHD